MVFTSLIICSHCTKTSSSTCIDLHGSYRGHEKSSSDDNSGLTFLHTLNKLTDWIWLEIFVSFQKKADKFHVISYFQFQWGLRTLFTLGQIFIFEKETLIFKIIFKVWNKQCPDQIWNIFKNPSKYFWIKFSVCPLFTCRSIRTSTTVRRLTNSDPPLPLY